MKIVDKDSDLPVYIQLSEIILDMIKSGELVEGDFLLPEREICKIQDISRMTVNKAILKLVNEGYLNRHVGKGTYIAKKKSKARYQKLQGLSEIMKAKGIALTNNILEFEVSKLSPYVKRKLNTESEEGYKIKRIRFLDEEPTVLETIYIDINMCPGLNIELLKNHSLYDLVQGQYKHKLLRAEQVIKPILLNNEQAKLLGQSVNTLALQIDRVVYTTEEKIFEYTSSIFMSNTHDFEVVLTDS